MLTYSFGPAIQGGDILFRLWAPLQSKVSLRIEGQDDEPMQRQAGGWYTTFHPRNNEPLHYRFVLEDGLVVPDPAARFQPAGPHGPSEFVDLESYIWKATNWKGRPWEESVIYELHIGTFTPEGTYNAAISKLDHLTRLGVTVLQLMPLNDFSGDRGWGYDGVLPYAPFHAYGRPEELQRLVDEAHQRGLSVFIDVVYNHLGPDGNFLPRYAPVFSDKHSSAWGQGINLDGDGARSVRDYFIENAVYWLDRFRFDGIRFDAVHALRDDSETHFLTELATRVRGSFPERHIHLILENEDNDSQFLERDGDGAPRLFTAQWNDDAHHVLHTAATNEDFGYYKDYARDGAKIARALAEGFAFQGEDMPARGKPRGQPSGHLPPTAFIAFIQNHDQVGNRAKGDRLSDSTTSAQRRALAAIYLLLPQIPMIFMGEEWDSRQPFPYFCDFDVELNRTVRDGRRKEFSSLLEMDAQSSVEIDPASGDTFFHAKLDWPSLANSRNSTHLIHYQALLDVRRKTIMPLLAGIRRGGRGQSAGPVVQVAWQTTEGELALIANLSDAEVPSQGILHGRVLWEEGEISDREYGPWSVRWTLG
ncbi:MULTISPECIES: malto-oligosyltrehalose trehalohydrolase [unclassified Rhizobium]|uniref:malto-oligosyltrehalose trehalohydrolase n=1 Tax=unclassified Rhizobium TaxID=2613769 RepID=UPI000701012D|nr:MULTISPECIES: malto-oligosyltrehalose trehalohydrolase [unclassified Rhizobium]KQV44065.1 malto-oligosyltrehalose trehalohydrolase [Rhizobium sp. Root1212]KRD38246.1 malto-oligosyltrehalose trehalohydrolase [Rhizobium sp. Root268]